MYWKGMRAASDDAAARSALDGRGLPDDVIEKLEATYHEAYESDEFQQWLKKIGVTPAWLGADDVTEWANDTQQQLFDTMDELVDKGVLEK